MWLFKWIRLIQSWKSHKWRRMRSKLWKRKNRKQRVMMLNCRRTILHTWMSYKKKKKTQRINEWFSFTHCVYKLLTFINLLYVFITGIPQLLPLNPSLFPPQPYLFQHLYHLDKSDPYFDIHLSHSNPGTICFPRTLPLLSNSGTYLSLYQPTLTFT